MDELSGGRIGYIHLPNTAQPGNRELTQHLLPQINKEALIMKLLISKKGETVNRDELLDKVWGYEPGTETRTVDNFIARLRKHFEKKPQKPRHIVTVREKGYQFNP